MNIRKGSLSIIAIGFLSLPPCSVGAERENKIHIAVKNRALSDVKQLLANDRSLINRIDGDRRTP
ncbi:MAG: hypothetical protein AAF664_12575, partial [Planctomycetota bacterium]